MPVNKKTMKIVAAVGSAVAVAVAVHSTADAGWRGPCSGNVNSNSYWVWCDGNGPESYRAKVQCVGTVGWKWFYGPWKWHGDRTGSRAVCPGGVNFANQGQVEFK